MDEQAERIYNRATDANYGRGSYVLLLAEIVRQLSRVADALENPRQDLIVSHPFPGGEEF